MPRYNLTEYPLNAPSYAGYFMANVPIGPTFCADNTGLCPAHMAQIIIDTGSSDFWVFGANVPDWKPIDTPFNCSEALTCVACSGSVSVGAECRAAIEYAAGTVAGRKVLDLVAGVYDEKVEFGVMDQFPDGGNSDVYPGGTWGLAFNAMAVSIYVPCLQSHNVPRYLHFNPVHICL